MKPNATLAGVVARAVLLCAAVLSTSAQAWTPPLPTEHISTTDASDLAFIQAMKAVIAAGMKRSGEPGLGVAVARHGKVIWVAGFGYANLETHAPVTPETVFKAGSMTKTYTATAVMQLVEQGVLSLDDRADKYLPFKVENPLGDRPVTIHDLMLHQSGLSAGDDGEAQAGTPRPLAVALAEAYARKNQRPYEQTRTPIWSTKVGATWQYSNLGAATLGLIVECANPEHLSLPDYVQKHILDPLSEAHSQYPAIQDAAHVRPDVWSRLSAGYTRIGPEFFPTPRVQIEGFPAGGAMLRPQDHIRLLLAYMNGGELDGHRILKPETVAEMINPQRDTPVDRIKQGLIWRIWDGDKPTAVFEHSGLYMYGWMNSAAAWPKLDAAFVASTNEWPLPGSATTRDLLQTFIGDYLALDAQAARTELTDATIGRLATAPKSSIDLSKADWKWKTSYVMGLIYVDALNGELGVTDRQSPQEIRALAEKAVFNPDAPNADAGFDKAAFVAGVEDLRHVRMTQPAIEAFRDSGKMRVSPDEVATVYKALGGDAGAGTEFHFVKPPAS
ncbi:MAG TPA: serine hydrolase domain-containing protein [Caulobacteraceae bacterium]|jgi:CubicO group peptidase (beta-lactamase class C family)|nr:serine hydrolase domain-containing protein [Caulobacteraceae bacterium]